MSNRTLVQVFASSASRNNCSPKPVPHRTDYRNGGTHGPLGNWLLLRGHNPITRRTVPSGRVACQDQRARRAPAGRILLPTTGCAESIAPASAAGSARREQETTGLETALPDPLHRPDPFRRIAGHPANSASFSYQAAAVDVQRFGHRDAQ